MTIYTVDVDLRSATRGALTVSKTVSAFSESEALVTVAVFVSRQVCAEWEVDGARISYADSTPRAASGGEDE